MQRAVNYIIIFLIVIVAGSVSGLLVLNVAFKTREVFVPSVVGMDSVTALKTLHEAQLNLVIVGQEHSLTVAEDSIISQQPEAGRKVKKKKNIKVILSLGSSKAAAPRLVGIPLREARMASSQRALKLGRVASVYHEGSHRDTIIAQDPPPGQVLEKGGSINLLVSAGGKPESYVMPDFIGQKIREVAELLEAMGVEPGSIEYREYKGFPPGTVIEQAPTAGHKISRGDKVALTLSKEVKGSSPRTGSFSMLRYRVPDDGPAGRVKIVVENESEVREIFNATREPGAEVQVMVKIEGETAARIYFNGALVLEKRF